MSPWSSCSNSLFLLNVEVDLWSLALPLVMSVAPGMQVSETQDGRICVSSRFDSPKVWWWYWCDSWYGLVDEAKGLISCSPWSISLEHPRGFHVQIDATHWLDDVEKAKLHALAEKTLQDVPVVREYLDMFPDELPGMPPDQDIEFMIDLVPRTGPIAKRP
jgi:hypothetical protein